MERENISAIKHVEKIERIRTYVLQFIYKDGNGWAIVNARTPNLAESVFKTQTKYEGARVTDIKESRWFGNNIQLVYEGAVTTVSNADITKIESIVNEAIRKYNFTDTIATAINRKFEELDLEELINIDLSNYVTKEDINKFVNEAIDNLNLSSYLTRQDVLNLISELNLHGRDGQDGQDGTNGADGVGISNITYNSNTGKLTIYLTDGSTKQFTITSSGGPSGIVEVSQIGHGPFSGSNSAVAAATANPNLMFQWILEEPVEIDGQSTTIRKIIWHVGNGEFIDAIGSVISND
jgi:hypothetical protein